MHPSLSPTLTHRRSHGSTRFVDPPLSSRFLPPSLPRSMQSGEVPPPTRIALTDRCMREASYFFLHFGLLRWRHSQLLAFISKFAHAETRAILHPLAAHRILRAHDRSARTVSSAIRLCLVPRRLASSLLAVLSFSRWPAATRARTRPGKTKRRRERAESRSEQERTRAPTSTTRTRTTDTDTRRIGPTATHHAHGGQFGWRRPRTARSRSLASDNINEKLQPESRGGSRRRVRQPGRSRRVCATRFDSMACR